MCDNVIVVIKSLYLLHIHIEYLTDETVSRFCFKIMHLKYIWGRKVENIHCRIGLGLIIAKVRGWVHGSSLLYSHYFCIHLKISTKQTNEGKQKPKTDLILA